MVDSPAKKLDFEVANKENVPIETNEPVELKKAVVDQVDLSKPATDIKSEVKAAVANTIKEDEADEPLLRENAHRFVLFPIKYHEVSRAPNASRVKWIRPHMGRNTD